MRLVTLNTWKCDGAYARRLARMEAGLAALAADVVTLQEVFLAPALGCDTAATLAAALGLEAAVLPLRRKPRNVAGRSADSWSGLAVLSRRPILSQRTIALPADPRDGERAALAVELERDGTRMTVVALHLTHLAGADALRRRQWDHIVAATADCPTVLAAGDFNAAAELFGSDGRLRECRRHLGIAPHSTLIGDGPAACIDHIFFSRDGRLAPTRCAEAMVETTLDRAASDHCAVVADFA